MRTLGLLMLMVFGVTAWSQVDEEKENKTAFSLKEAQEYALTHAFSNRDRELEFEKAKRTINETRAIGLPQVSAGLDFTYNAQIGKTAIPSESFPGMAPGDIFYLPMGVTYSNIGNLNVNQLIFDGSYFVALQASKVVKEGARLDVQRSEIEIRRDVAQAYYGVLVTEETIEIIKENVESLQKNFKETRALYDNGFVEEQDVDQLELLVTGLENTLDRSERQLILAKMLLNFNMGRYIETEIELTDKTEELMVSEEAVQESAFKLDANVNFKYVQAVERGAQLSVKNEKWKYAPTISGFVRHGQSNYTNDFDQTFDFNHYWIPNTAIGASLKWDLFTGLRRNAVTQKAKLDLEQATLARMQTANQLTMQYEQAKSDYEYAFDNYNTTKRNVELSKRIRDKTRIKYQEGISSSLDLTQVENQYFEIQQNYLQALQQLLNAKENLDAAIGQP
ncbi:TolC family protein [Owenweeksia hongkongensis]|uniref:Outer membrane protein n=1 Tax=Owenweeksia hongkongensis (strain DSM 17368 / CIP 108786 / JCM 12287 / NRRL B-23963 / UST20020801) TaxID=926562 RepID=G8R4Q2_OWEHD|nr:TolC family protein [Owenweeksia hongkongensis]AEV33176.1 outer membrane protein [Owenweeksia hongkongensis DSM 17368]